MRQRILCAYTLTGVGVLLGMTSGVRADFSAQITGTVTAITGDSIFPGLTVGADVSGAFSYDPTGALPTGSLTGLNRADYPDLPTSLSIQFGTNLVNLSGNAGRVVIEDTPSFDAFAYRPVFTNMGGFDNVSAFLISNDQSAPFGLVSNLDLPETIADLNLSEITDNSGTANRISFSSGGQFGTIHFDYLPSPVPEPTTLSLLILGGVALLHRRR